MSDSSDGRSNVFADWYSLIDKFYKATKIFSDAETSSDDFIVVVHEFQALVIRLRMELRNLEQKNQIPQKWSLVVQQELRRYNAYTTDKISHVFGPQRDPSFVELSELLRSSLVNVLSLSGPRAEDPGINRTADSYTPTDWINSAHDSILKALAQCSVCHCTPSHDLSSVILRVALKTHRQFLESVCSVSIFVRAIDSWQETIIKVEKTLEDITLRVTDETDSDASSELDDENRVESLCRECQEAKRPIMCLRLVVKCDEGNSLFRLTSEQRNWKWIDAVSLQHLLERSDLRISPEPKRVLLLLVSYTLLHFFDAFWLENVWNSSKIVFPIKPTGICLTPYVETQPISISATSAEENKKSLEHAQQPRFLSRDRHSNGHPFPFLVVLAVLLLEIHEKQSSASLARHYDVSLDTEEDDVARFLEAREVYKRLKKKESDKWLKEDKIFFKAISTCLDKKWWLKVTDEHDMRSRIYKHIVQNLQEYFAAYQGKLSDVDTFEDALPLPEHALQLVEDFPIHDTPLTQEEFAQLATHDAACGLSDTAMVGLVSESLNSQTTSNEVKRPPENTHEMKNTETVQYRILESPAIGQGNVVGSDMKVSNVSNSQSPVNKNPSLGPITRSQLRIRFFDDDNSPKPQKKIDSSSNWKVSFIQVYDEFLRSNPGRQPAEDYSTVCIKGVNSERIKIAVIDTGYDVTHSAFKIAKLPCTKQNPITRKCCSACLDKWEQCQPGHMHDHIGHGTHVAGLLLDFAKDAELQIIKLDVIESTDLNSGHLLKIAKALDVAIQDWEVNIISISFGWPKTAALAFAEDFAEAYTEYENAIKRASDRALVFAAATNDGPNVGRAWPARENGVFCVHSTDGKGTWSSDINPQKWNPDESLNLAVLGEAVESYWPCLDPKQPVRMTKMIRSGTSYAAPIAASIAAFLLMFGQKYLDKEQATNLKEFHHMRAVLQAVCKESIAEGHVKPEGFNYLHLSLDSDNLFGKGSDKIIEIIGNALRGRG